MLVFAVLFLLTAPAVFGRGTPEDMWQTVEASENWQHEIDLSEQDPGVYNVIVRGVDAAGNVATAGPVNLRIDPESDKPVARIIYPEDNRIVRGDVHVIGVAIDDDSVSRVELKVNDGAWRTVDGADYWRSLIRSGDLPDGPHTLTVRAVDVNGLIGDDSTSRFVLDTKPPEIVVTSHESGAVVNGRVRFGGTVADANGIDDLRLSRDDRETFERVRARYDRNEDLYTFNFDVRTDRLDDGPIVYWLEATDGAANTTLEPFLFFVDNQPPEITVIDPELETAVSGHVVITGSVRDQVGIESFEYEWNGETIPVELIPGNPYWSVAIDTTGHRGRWVDVRFTAVDTSGNRAAVRHRLANDQDAALPRVVIDWPSLDVSDPIAADAAIYGHVTGANTPVAVRVSGIVDEPRDFPASPGFRVPLTDAGSGRLDLRIAAIDDRGLIGPELRYRPVRQAPPPRIALAAVEYADGESVEYAAGIEYDSTRNAVVSGRIETSAAVRSVTAEIETGDGPRTPRVASRRTDPGVFTFSFPIDRSVGYGVVRFAVTVVDEFDATVEHTGFVYSRDLRRIERAPGILLIDERRGADDVIRIGADLTPVVGRIIGLTGGAPTETFSAVAITPENDIVRIEHEGSLVRLVPLADGRIDDVFLRAETESGFVLEEGPFAVLVDTTAPEIVIEAPSGPDHTGSSMTIAGRITDAGGAADAAYSLDGGVTFTDLPLSGARDERTFSVTVDLGETPEPAYAVAVHARDVVGNTSRSVVVVNRLAAESAPPTDGPEAEARRNDVPVIDLLYPRANTVHLGRVQIAGVVRDLDGTREIQMSVDGGEFAAVATFGERRHHQVFLFETPALGVGTRTVRLRAIDRLGLSSRENTVRITVASSASVISLGGEGEPLAPGFRVALGERTDVPGLISNAERIASARYRINDTDWVSLGTRAAEIEFARAFSVRFPNSLVFGEHLLEIEAVDRDGIGARKIVPFFVGDTAAPPPYAATVVFHDDRVSDDTILFGTADELSGRFTGPAVSTAELSGADDLLRLTRDGKLIRLEPVGQGTADAVSVIVTTIDGAEYRSRSRRLVVDYEPPSLELELPATGAFVASSLTAAGIATDAVELDALSYRLGFDGGYTQIPVDDDGLFEAEVLTEESTRGPRHLFVRASDTFGNSSEVWLPVFFDPDPPTVRFVTPVVDEAVNGLTRVVARLSSESPVESVSYSLDDETFSRLEPSAVIEFLVDFSVLELDDRSLVLRVTDRAGNDVTVTPRVLVDLDADFPVVQIQIPESNAVVTSDLAVTGIVLDDDGIGAVFWRIGSREFERISAGTNFRIDIPLSELGDNDQTIEVYAEDLYGLRGESAEVTVRVSTAAPEISIDSPNVDQTLRGTIVLAGNVADRNGIERVLVSFDNGVSFQEATVTSADPDNDSVSWRYNLDSTVLLDGTYSVQIVAVDGLGVESRIFSLVNIDNTSPTLDLTFPVDGQTVSGFILINGRFLDNLEISTATARIEPIDHDGDTIEIDLPLETVLADRIGIEALAGGWYNVRVGVVDGAGNEALVSRNVFVRDEVEGSTVSIVFPLEGDTVSGPLVVSGHAVSASPVRRATVFLDGEPFGVAEIDERGYFHLPIGSVDDGQRVVTAVLEPAGGDRVTSEPRRFVYRAGAPYISITSRRPGDFLSDRPWIDGVVEYPVPESAEDDDRAAIRSRRVERVIVSLDNGRTFETARGGETWRYRVETADVSDGPLTMLAVAEFADGTTVSTRTLYTVDTTAPRIELVTPEENRLVNTTLTMSGIASDINGLRELEFALRPGDKAGYAVPSFIQGMYVDVHALGLTYFQIGLGLTFFDQNVKLQANFGVSPETTSDGGPARFAGNFFGGKILANVASVPFSVFFGPDWEFLSANIAIGASFNYIALFDPVTPFGGDPVNGVVLSAIIAQLEFPRIMVPDRSMFNAYSVYVEPQVWFVPSDIRPDIAIRLTFGARMQLF